MKPLLGFGTPTTSMFEEVVAKLTRFAKDASPQMRSARPHLPDELSDRAQDNWEPLLAIAEYAGAQWLRRATTAALTLSSASDAAASTGNELLADIREVFERRQGRKIGTADLITALTRDEEKPGPRTTAATRSRRVSCRNNSRRTGQVKDCASWPSRHAEGYESSQFDDAFARYLGSESGTVPLDSDCEIAAGVTDQRSPPEVTAAVPDPDGSSLHADAVAMLSMDDPAPSPDADIARLDGESFRSSSRDAPAGRVRASAPAAKRYPME